MAPAPSGHHARRVLAVRAIAAQVDWLFHAPPHWVEDRVAWRLSDGRDLFPEAADLARAQRLLYKTRQYPLASRAVFADPDRWRSAARSRLALIGCLRLLRADSGHGDLLLAEALCGGGAVPGPPSGALVALALAGRTAPADYDRVTDLANDADLPLPARMLAALTLGAMLRAQGRQQGTVPVVPPLSPSVRAAFERGLRGGPGKDTPLLAALFAVLGEAGAERGERLVAAGAHDDLPLPSPFPVPFALLRETLLQATAADTDRARQLLAAAEMLPRRGSDVARRLLCWRHEITPNDYHPKDRRFKSHDVRREEAQSLRESRREASRNVTVAFDRLLRAGTDCSDLPALTASVLDFADHLLTISPPSLSVLAVLESALGLCLALPAPLRAAFFDLACLPGTSLWDFSTLKKFFQDNRNTAGFSEALMERWLRKGTELRDFLQRVGEAELVREAVCLGVYDAARSVVTAERGDREHLRLHLRWVRLFRPDPPENDSRWCPFLNALQNRLLSFTEGAEARESLLPLERVFTDPARDPLRRTRVRQTLTALLLAIPSDRAERTIVTGGIAAVARQFLPWAEAATEENWDNYGDAIADVAVLLAKKAPEQRVPYFDCFLAALSPTSQTRPSVNVLGVELAVGLAGGDTDRFAALLPLALSQLKDENDWGEQDWLRHGIRLLARFPDLTVPLAALFPTRTRRCIALLQYIGRAGHLGSDVLSPLAECRFESSETAESGDPEWQAVLALAPDFAPLAAQLWQAQWLGGTPAAVPPGVRRLVEERTRRAGELAYIETLCETEHAAPGLLLRRDSLRARLETGETRADTVAEVRDRLRQAVGEAQIAVAERQAALCFRERLRQTVGPLPAGLVLTPEVENATLLSFTITRNRKPLLKLLRAAVLGEPNPFEDHPANVAFRQRLAEQGADTDAWRDAAPRRVSLPNGQTLLLTLETDPLHILQMGNYFGTCLSAGSGCNAFSTVANALEMNKRVLFARDSGGKVVARKLIGITESGALVGFFTYCSLSPEEGAGAARAAVREYLAHFAAGCRLSLADTGDVPKLFCDGWYDDGTVAWAEPEGEGKLSP